VGYGVAVGSTGVKVGYGVYVGYGVAVGSTGVKVGYGVYVGYGVGVAIGSGAGVSNCWLSPLQATNTIGTASSRSSGIDFSFISSPPLNPHPIIPRQGYAAEQRGCGGSGCGCY
jgi:hypothetical protein